MSMEEIGREFSGRDHSTIVYSLKTMERDMKLSLIHISLLLGDEVFDVHFAGDGLYLGAALVAEALLHVQQDVYKRQA